MLLQFGKTAKALQLSFAIYSKTNQTVLFLSRGDLTTDADSWFSTVRVKLNLKVAATSLKLEIRLHVNQVGTHNLVPK